MYLKIASGRRIGVDPHMLAAIELHEFQPYIFEGFIKVYGLKSIIIEAQQRSLVRERIARLYVVCIGARPGDLTDVLKIDTVL